MSAPGKVEIDKREFDRLYAIYLECLRVRSKGIQQFHRLPPQMRVAIVELIALYKYELPVHRAIDFVGGDRPQFISNQEADRA